MAPETTIVVHGGAGNPAGGGIADERAHHEALAAALLAAHDVLGPGGDALAGAVAAVEVLEDCPLFNAGRGSVLGSDGAVEMDAAVMRGEDRRAGAVAAVTGVRHPVALALAVLSETKHVLLAGQGAERLAAEHGLERMDADWFVTEREWRRSDESLGTVGAVALDARGHVAAATSTGGVRGQLPGRVGDSPIVGAGTWADDATCALSATGHGERLIRAVAAHEVTARIEHLGMPLAEACETVLRERVGGQAGLIALGPRGNVAMPFTTELMYRGVKVGDAEPRTAIWPDTENALPSTPAG